MESLIHDEVEALCHELRKDAAEADGNCPEISGSTGTGGGAETEQAGINIRHRFNISVINALWTMITGKRFELDNPSLLTLVKRMDRSVIMYFLRFKKVGTLHHNLR